MIVSRTHYFHNAAIIAADGVDMNVAGLNTLRIQISGTSSSRSIDFLASVDTVNFVAIMGLDMTTLSPSTTTTDTAKIFDFDVRGIFKMRMDLTAVAGGTVTVYGLAIK